jgi:hypothetical protein
MTNDRPVLELVSKLYDERDHFQALCLYELYKRYKRKRNLDEEVRTILIDHLTRHLDQLEPDWRETIVERR